MWFLHLVAFDAVIDVKCILTFAMTNAAGLTLFHVSHGCFGCPDTIRENLCMAIVAFICLQVELVAERGFAGWFWNHIAEFARFETFVAF
jgi:hypothetical protein